MSQRIEKEIKQVEAPSEYLELMKIICWFIITLIYPLICSLSPISILDKYYMHN